MRKRNAGHPGRIDAPITLPPSLEVLLGEEAPLLKAALESPSPVSIRNNPLKGGHLPGVAVPWCAHGRYLDERPVFTLDPHLHGGGYYVQEAGSMLLEQALLASGLLEHDILALDLCAAPGGKSTHLASLMSPGSMLIANETVPQRRLVLAENLWKHGRAATAIGRGQPERFAELGGMFDLIVVDAPCSGEGMFRKDAFARQQWSEGLVRNCAVLQNSILASAWQALEPGGVLIYSTCTWERSENEEQVLRLIAERDARPVHLSIRPEWGVQATDAGYRCYPHRVKGEGFFLSVLSKPGERVGRLGTSSASAPLPAELAGLVHRPEEFALMMHQELPHVIPLRWIKPVDRLFRAGLLQHPGIPLAERKGDAWRPHAAWALSTALRNEAFPTLDLDRKDALDYLRGAALNASDAQGVQLVRHEGSALGWVQGAGNRWNNRWPEAWRIRMR